MTTTTPDRTGRRVDRVVTNKRLLGTASRWRRFGKPTPAGRQQDHSGTVDDGLFGPGSLAWDVILHPAVIVLETVAQGYVQTAYKPVAAGVRDKDSMTRKGRAGTLTLMDIFDRAQRNSGIHAPMWLGDTPTAQRVAEHLLRIHAKVTSDTIDVGDPELGGYAASGPRDSMWAALTEAESMLWLYEGTAFRDGRAPHRMTADERDAYIAEFAAYVRLFPHADEPPTTVRELNALHRKYAKLFEHSDTMNVMPDGGEDYHRWLIQSALRNFHLSQVRVLVPMIVLFLLCGDAVRGCLPSTTRQSMGLTPTQEARAVRARQRALPMLWLLQRRPVEQYFMRLMWGPDAVTLIESARELHARARGGRPGRAAEGDAPGRPADAGTVRR